MAVHLQRQRTNSCLCVCVYTFICVLPVHSGDDSRRGSTRWRRETRRRDSNGQPYRGEEMINTFKAIKANKSQTKYPKKAAEKEKDNDDAAELTGWRDERGGSADVGWWREERRRWYVWRKWSRREEGRYFCCSRISI